MIYGVLTGGIIDFKAKHAKVRRQRRVFQHLLSTSPCLSSTISAPHFSVSASSWSGGSNLFSQWHRNRGQSFKAWARLPNTSVILLAASSRSKWTLNLTDLCKNRSGCQRIDKTWTCDPAVNQDVARLRGSVLTRQASRAHNTPNSWTNN